MQLLLFTAGLLLALRVCGQLKPKTRRGGSYMTPLATYSSAALPSQ